MPSIGDKMSLDLYEKKGVIGKGSYGEVWLVKHKKDKKQYVLKKLDLQNASKRERKAAEQEAKLLSKLKHPNIVSYKDSFECDQGFLFIAMGYCEGGDLYTRLKENKSTALEEQQVVEWFVQIAMALQYMHERNILHRDLKTQNIFLTKSKIIKVGDLGIARVLDTSSDMATTLIGTPYYMSPELFSNKPYNHKSDVWALGCCVYEMTTLKHAFNAKDMNSLVYKILRGKMPAMPKSYSSELVALIKAMLNHNPDKRPSVNRILRDPYIKKNIAIFLEGTKKSRRPSASRLKASSAASSRRSTPTGDQSEPPDSARSSASSVAAVAKVYEKSKQTPPVDIHLEPLQAGPDLTPIKEEVTPRGSDMSNSGDSQASNKPSNMAVKPLPAKGDGKISPSNAPQTSNAEPTNSKKKKRRFLLDVASGNKVGGAKNASRDPDTVDSPRNQRQEPRVPSPRRGKTRSPSPRMERASNAADRKSPIIHLAEPRNRAVTDRDRPVVSHHSPSPQPRLQARPLPPRPAVSASSQNQVESGYVSASSSAASSQDIYTPRPEQTPRGPNLSARERRREKKESETPRSSRSVDIDRSRRSHDDVRPSVPGQRDALKAPGPVDMVDGRLHPRVSADAVLNKPSRKEPLIIKKPTEPVKVQAGPMKAPSGPERSRNQQRKQPSLEDDDQSSSSSEEERPGDRDKRRKDKEMNNFISLLDTTLRLNKPTNNSDDDDDDIVISVSKSDEISAAPVCPPPEPEELLVPVVEVENLPPQQMAPQANDSSGAGKTMTTTGRLWERITHLRKDCIRGLGVKKLKEAYDILDKFEADELEPRLVELLSQEQFDLYAGKIWQLKFCEEAAFGLI